MSRLSASMAPFQWMVVSPEAQAANLVGAYQYAEAHYPWMGAMFFFNYSIGVGCDQMAFFRVQGRPAEAALIAMPKRYVPSIAAWRGARTVVVDVGVEGVAVGEIWRDNLAYGRLGWQAAVVAGTALDGRLTLPAGAGALGEQVHFTIDPSGLTPGLHRGRIALSATAPLGVPVENAAQEVEVALMVATDRVHLPVISREGIGRAVVRGAHDPTEPAGGTR